VDKIPNDDGVYMPPILFPCQLQSLTALPLQE
jgi:hypothetical protein